MSQYEAAVTIVKDYKEFLDFLSERYGYSFEEWSYSRSAVNEILKRLEEHKDEAPLDVIENYRDKVSEYAHLKSQASFIFSVALNTAEEIIDLFM